LTPEPPSELKSKIIRRSVDLGIDNANPDLDLILKDYRSPKEINTVINYMGAVNFPSDIDKYLIKELQKSAITGPFHVNPFSHGMSN
jgi:hypothetical protein